MAKKLLNVPIDVSKADELRRFLLQLVEKLEVALSDNTQTAIGDSTVDFNYSSLAARVSELETAVVPLANVRSSRPKIAGALSAVATATLALTVNRVYFIPITVLAITTVTALGFSVTAGAAGSAVVGIYSNTYNGGQDGPKDLLVKTGALNLGSIAEQSENLTFTFMPGVVYWVAITGSSAATIRALAVESIRSLGLASSSSAHNTHAYVAGSGTLPTTVASFTMATGVTPALLLFGA